MCTDEVILYKKFVYSIRHLLSMIIDVVIEISDYYKSRGRVCLNNAFN